MTVRVSWKPLKLTPSDYQKKLESDNIMDKFDAISHEVQNIDIGKFNMLRLLVYLEWFFDKVIEKKVEDTIARKKLQDFTFQRKMELMKDYGLLIGANFRDVKRIKNIRNEITHKLQFDEKKVSKELGQLERYNEAQFKDLDPFDKCVAIIIDIMGIFTTAIHTHFDFLPTKDNVKF